MRWRKKFSGDRQRLPISLFRIIKPLKMCQRFCDVHRRLKREWMILAVYAAIDGIELLPQLAGLGPAVLTGDRKRQVIPRMDGRIGFALANGLIMREYRGEAFFGDRRASSA